MADDSPPVTIEYQGRRLIVDNSVKHLIWMLAFHHQEIPPYGRTILDQDRDGKVKMTLPPKVIESR